MKKFLAIGAVALLVAIFSIQQACAWVNFKTGVGANLGYQSGGNTLLWGLFHNGQPGGPDAPCGFPLPGCVGSAAPTQYYAPGQSQSRYTAPAHKTGATGYSTSSPYSPRR